MPAGGACAYLPGDALQVSTTRGVAESVVFGSAGASPLLAAAIEAWAPNGSPTVVRTGNGGTRTVTLDEQERVARIAVRDDAGALLWDSGSQLYDGLEHVLSIGALGTAGIPGTHPQSFRHDAQGRLVHAELPTGDVDYSYDDFGNMTSRTGTLLATDSPGIFTGRQHFEADVHDNRIHEEGFEHDPSGNMTLLPDPRRVLVWDALGRMRQVQDDSGAALSRMAYDSTGERLLVEAGGELRYFHRGGAAAVLAEYTRDGSSWKLVREHVDGLDGSLGEVALDGTAPSVRYHGRDHLGTPRAMTDAAGALTSLNVLEPFGMDVPDAGGWETTHRFTGHERDDVTGLDYMHARYHAAELGRFLSADPGWDTGTGVPQSWNRLAYVLNHPEGSIDATGRHIGIAIGAVVGGVAGGVAGYIKSGGDPKATASALVGGAVAGAVVGSGAGLIAAAAAKGGMLAAVSTGAGVAAAGGAAGSVAGQITTGLLDGKSPTQAVQGVDPVSVAHSAAMSAPFGAASGLLVGAGTALASGTKVTQGAAYLVSGSGAGMTAERRVSG